MQASSWYRKFIRLPFILLNLGSVERKGKKIQNFPYHEKKELLD